LCNAKRVAVADGITAEVEKGEDTTHVYKDGYKIEYFGVIDPNTFVSWLLDVPDEPLTIVNTEFELAEFESLAEATPRVIGYFDPGSQGELVVWHRFFTRLPCSSFSAALKEFEEAAEDFMGEIEFYAVVDTFVRVLVA